MCEHAHVRNLPALIVYVDRQGEQPPARGMNDPTCRDVPADGRRGVPAQLSRGAHPRPRPMFQNRWTFRERHYYPTCKEFTKTKYTASKPAAFVNPPGRLTSSISTTI